LVRSQLAALLEDQAFLERQDGVEELAAGRSEGDRVGAAFGRALDQAGRLHLVEQLGDVGLAVAGALGQFLLREALDGADVHEQFELAGIQLVAAQHAIEFALGSFNQPCHVHPGCQGGMALIAGSARVLVVALAFHGPSIVSPSARRQATPAGTASAISTSPVWATTSNVSQTTGLPITHDAKASWRRR